MEFQYYEKIRKQVECIKWGPQEKNDEIASTVEKYFISNGYIVTGKQDPLLNPGFVANICAKNKNAVKQEIMKILNLNINDINDNNQAITLSEDVIDAVAKTNLRFKHRDIVYEKISPYAQQPFAFLSIVPILSNNNNNNNNSNDHEYKNNELEIESHPIRQLLLSLEFDDPEGVEKIKRKHQQIEIEYESSRGIHNIFIKNKFKRNFNNLNNFNKYNKYNIKRDHDHLTVPSPWPITPATPIIKPIVTVTRPHMRAARDGGCDDYHGFGHSGCGRGGIGGIGGSINNSNVHSGFAHLDRMHMREHKYASKYGSKYGSTFSTPKFKHYKIGICGNFSIYEEAKMAQQIQDIESELCMDDYTLCDIVIFDNFQTYQMLHQDLRKDCSCVNKEWLANCARYKRNVDFEKYSFAVEFNINFDILILVSHFFRFLRFLIYFVFVFFVCGFCVNSLTVC